MAKFFGTIGYGIPTEIKSGVWTDVITKRYYYGDILRASRTLQSTTQVNDNITIANEISILSDPFANENYHKMVYVEYLGSKWKVSMVDVQYPRLVLTLGGLYNGQ